MAAHRRIVATVTVVAAALLLPTGGVEAAGAPGDTRRVSVASDGSQGAGDAWIGGDAPAVSGTGRYVAFATRAALDPLDADNDYYYDGDLDIYLRDRRSPGRTVLISRGGPAIETAMAGQVVVTLGAPAAESPANGNSTAPAISADGRFVAFDTSATNIADLPWGGGETDVLVCDRDPDGDGTFDERGQDGAMDYRYVVVGNRYRPGDTAPFRNSAPSISADARTIAWTEHDLSDEDQSTLVARLGVDDAGRLVPPPTSDSLRLRPPEGYHAAVPGGPARVAAGGGQVVFGARLLGETPSGYADRSAVFVTDLGTGRTDRMDVGPDGAPLPGGAVDPAISGDGRVVAFAVADDTPRRTGRESGGPRVDVLAVDRDPDGDGNLWPATGERVRQTVVSRDNAGGPGGGSDPALSADGRYLAFETDARGMHDGIDTTRPHGEGGPVVNRQIVVRDLVVDARRESAGGARLPGALASPAHDRACVPEPGDRACAGDGDSTAAALSADGAVVAFESTSEDLVAGDTNGAADVFAHAFTPVLRADPVRFATVPAGSRATATVVVRHVGFGPLRIRRLGVTGRDAAEFAVLPAENCRDAVLHATDTCLVSVAFRPGATGRKEASLLVEGGSAPLAVPLVGEGGPAEVPPGLRLSPGELVFPGERLALTPSDPVVLTVANPGETPIAVTGTELVTGPHLFARDYRVVRSTCATVPPGGTCRVVIVNQPRGSGDRPGALVVTDDTGGVHLVGLRARGTTATAAVDPAVVTAGRVVEVTGTGFPANHRVTVTLDGRLGAGHLADTNATGGFDTPLVVLGHVPVGTRTVTVTAVGTDLLATAPLLVVPGTYQPPAFTSRR